MKRIKTYTILFLLGSFLFSCESEEGGESILEDVPIKEDVDKQQVTREIEVVAENMRFHPDEFKVLAGQNVRVTLVNRGNAKHNIEFELPEGEIEFEEPLQPDEEKTLEFIAPQEPGEYTVYCPVADHKDLGMTGRLIVE